MKSSLEKTPLNENYLRLFSLAFLIIGSVTYIISLTVPKSYVNGIIISYSFVFFGMFIAFIYKSFFINNWTLMTFVNFMPMVILTGFLLFIIVIVSVNMNKLSTGYIDKKFNSLMTVYSILIGLCMCLVIRDYFKSTTNSTATSSNFNSVTNACITFLLSINFFVGCSIYTVLTYYQTDG
jgi:hypothetical protein